jgi:hypothetical protein
MTKKIVENVARVLRMPKDWREAAGGRYIMAVAMRQALWG